MHPHHRHRSLLLAGFLALSLTSCARSAGQPATSPSIKAAFFALTVSDVDAIAAWYTANLGFKIQLRSEPANGGPRGAILVRDGARLELLEFTTAKPRTAWGLPLDAEQIHGILKVGFEVSDVDTLFAMAQQRHLDIFFPLVTPPGSRLRTFGLRDPDGNIIQFFGK